MTERCETSTRIFENNQWHYIHKQQNRIFVVFNKIKIFLKHNCVFLTNWWSFEEQICGR